MVLSDSTTFSQNFAPGFIQLSVCFMYRTCNCGIHSKTTRTLQGICTNAFHNFKLIFRRLKSANCKQGQTITLNLNKPQRWLGREGGCLSNFSFQSKHHTTLILQQAQHLVQIRLFTSEKLLNVSALTTFRIKPTDLDPWAWNSKTEFWMLTGSRWPHMMINVQTVQTTHRSASYDRSW